MVAQVFVSATGAEPGTERYFEEAIDAGFYGSDDDAFYAFRWVSVEQIEKEEKARGISQGSLTLY